MSSSDEAGLAAAAMDGFQVTFSGFSPAGARCCCGGLQLEVGKSATLYVLLRTMVVGLPTCLGTPSLASSSFSSSSLEAVALLGSHLTFSEASLPSPLLWLATGDTLCTLREVVLSSVDEADEPL